MSAQAPPVDPPERAVRIHATPSRIESLHLIETACWLELERAAEERGHGWRVMTLATVSDQEAQARSVIVREVDSAARQLTFYTDDRSPKLQQIQQHPHGTLLAWCPRLSWQLRLRVHLSRETDLAKVQARWSRLHATPAAQDYLSPLAPGEPLGRAAHERGSREHFAIVNAQVTAADWLELHAQGHRRALFGPGGPQWVQP